MASSLEFVTYVADVIADSGIITYKKMFGDYGVYCNGKIVALVCDNMFYVKPTAGGKNLLKTPIEAPPYKGAKPYFLIEDLDNRELLTELIKISYKELPMQKPKNKKG